MCSTSLISVLFLPGDSAPRAGTHAMAKHRTSRLPFLEVPAMLGLLAAAAAAPPDSARVATAMTPHTQQWQTGDIKDQCIALKNKGAAWGGPSDIVEQDMLERFKGKEFVIILQADPYASTDFSAPRQYARTLLGWEPVKTKQLNMSYWVANETHPVPTDYGDRKFIIFGMVESPIIKQAVDVLRGQNASFILIHDSLCFKPDGTHHFPMGCPNELIDFQDSHPGGIPPKGLYFTPWGSEEDVLYADKTEGPSMFIDATADWKAPDDMTSKQFVRLIKKRLPFVKVTVLGGEDIDTKNITHYQHKVPFFRFHELLRESWFFVTGIESSYELSVADAAMAGAVLVDVSNASKLAVKAPNSVIVRNATDAVAAVRWAVDNYKASDMSHQTRTWARNFHNARYIGLNLMCSIHAVSRPDSSDWTRDQFGVDPDLYYLQANHVSEDQASSNYGNDETSKDSDGETDGELPAPEGHESAQVQLRVGQHGGKRGHKHLSKRDDKRSDKPAADASWPEPLLGGAAPEVAS